MYGKSSSSSLFSIPNEVRTDLWLSSTSKPLRSHTNPKRDNIKNANKKIDYTTKVLNRIQRYPYISVVLIWWQYNLEQSDKCNKVAYPYTCELLNKVQIEHIMRACSITNFHTLLDCSIVLIM